MVNILAIDRDEDTLAQIRSSLDANRLTRAKFQIVCATDPDAGLKAVDSLRPGLVIVDIRIAAKDGIEVVKDLQRRAPHAKVIGLSGSSLIHAEAFEAVVNQLGIERLLAKPIESPLLLRTVLELLPLETLRTDRYVPEGITATRPISRQFSHFAPLLASH